MNRRRFLTFLATAASLLLPPTRGSAVGIIAERQKITVTRAVPLDLTSLTPAAAPQGADAVAFSIMGSGIRNRPVTVDLGAGVTVVGTPVAVSSSEITFVADVDAGAAVGTRTLTVTIGARVATLPDALTVYAVDEPSGPTFTGLTPAVIPRGQPNTHILTVEGTNLEDAVFSFTGSGVNVLHADVEPDGLSAELTVEAAANAEKTTRALTITTPFGGVTVPDVLEVWHSLIELLSAANIATLPLIDGEVPDPDDLDGAYLTVPLRYIDGRFDEGVHFHDDIGGYIISVDGWYLDHLRHTHLTKGGTGRGDAFVAAPKPALWDTYNGSNNNLTGTATWARGRGNLEVRNCKRFQIGADVIFGGNMDPANLGGTDAFDGAVEQQSAVQLKECTQGLIRAPGRYVWGDHVSGGGRPQSQFGNPDGFSRAIIVEIAGSCYWNGSQFVNGNLGDADPLGVIVGRDATDLGGMFGFRYRMVNIVNTQRTGVWDIEPVGTSEPTDDLIYEDFRLGHFSLLMFASSGGHPMAQIGSVITRRWKSPNQPMSGKVGHSPTPNFPTPFRRGPYIFEDGDTAGTADRPAMVYKRAAAGSAVRRCNTDDATGQTEAAGFASLYDTPFDPDDFVDNNYGDGVGNTIQYLEAANP